ncbi:hypothetical protein [Mesorhizobium australafricanum]|uniref:Uncharacterized protein n=1 Tax=Mesorhizobium australafricanum TaxID=3072311 RepID=A0ABU4WTP8_9HYPH|nr:hypothetical protein [Mesorhizobium sp. VK3E]MDX8438365.1 hypothetical protein [Mesorhizobium sp. VK3E]
MFKNVAPFSWNSFRIMFRAVTDTQLIPAIALALVVSFAWFLVAYRLHKRGLPAEPETQNVALSLWVALPVIATMAYYWVVGKDVSNVTTIPRLFVCTIVGVIFASLIIGAFQMAFFGHSLQKRTRVLTLINGSGLIVLLLYAAFAG